MNQYGYLLEVQHIDSEIAILDRTLGELPEAATLAEARAALTTIERRLGDLEEDLHAEERVQTRLEQDVATIAEKIARENQKLMSGSVTNPKELAGIQAEVKSLEGHKDAMETSLLEQMEKTDAIRRERDETAAGAAAAREAEAAADAAHEKVTGELGSRRDALVAERDAATANIEPALLARYDKFRSQFRGVGVGKLQGQVCTACRVDLPDLELKRIAASDELDRCPECRRLLVTDRLLGAK